MGRIYRRVLLVLCGRRGMALAHVAIMIWSVVGGGATFIAYKLYDRFEAMETLAIRIDRQLSEYIAVTNRGNLDENRRFTVLETVSKELMIGVADHERRIYRLEGRR